MNALIEAGWTVAEPVVRDSHDLLAKSPRSDVWLPIQVKTVHRRERDGQIYPIIYATKSDGKTPYREDEVAYFVGVDGDDCYLVLNRRKKNLWKPRDNSRIDPRKTSAWVLLDGENTQYMPWMKGAAV